MMLETMYPAAVNSRQTELAAAINDTQTSFTVLDGSVLPPAPNQLTLGTDESAETILYTGKSGNEITGITRSFEGVAKSWVAGTKLARYFTAYDHETFRQNVSDLDERINNIPAPEDASLTQKGIVQLSNSTSGDRDNIAATESAVGAVHQQVIDLEDTLIETSLNYIRQPGYAVTSGTSTVYIATLSPAPATLPDGFGITIVPHVANGANPTLNVNGLGAVPLKDQKGVAYTAGKLIAGRPYTFRKVGSDFLADSSGGSGNAVAGDIRAGKTATNDGGDVVGNVVVRNTSQTSITPTTSAQTLQPGIYDYPIVVAGVPAATADLLTQTQSVPANSSRAFNYATQPNIAFVTTSASMAQQHSMMLLGPTPRINHNGTVLFTDTLNPNSYNSALSYTSWNGSSYQIYNNNGVAANLTVEAYFKR